MLLIAGMALLAHPLIGGDRMTAAAFTTMRRPQIQMAVFAWAAGKIISATMPNSFGFRSWIFGKIIHDSSGDAGR